MFAKFCSPSINLITSCIAVCFSIIAMCQSVPRFLSSDELQFDYIGAILGVLSILVTVLIGWNILNYMQFKDSMKKIAEDEVKSMTEDYKAVLNGLSMLNGKNAMLIGNSAYLIDNSFDALQKLLECKNEELSKFAIDYVMGFIYEVSQMGENEIYKGKQSEYLYSLGKISHKYKTYIIRYIEAAKEVEPQNIDKKMESLSDSDIDEIIRKVDQTEASS